MSCIPPPHPHPTPPHTGGYPAGVEVDWVAGGDVVHVDMNVFSAKDWKLSWLLLLPAVNYAKDWIR